MLTPVEVCAHTRAYLESRGYKVPTVRGGTVYTESGHGVQRMQHLSNEQLIERLLELADYMSAITNNADAELVREAVRRLG